VVAADPDSAAREYQSSASAVAAAAGRSRRRNGQSIASRQLRHSWRTVLTSPAPAASGRRRPADRPARTPRQRRRSRPARPRSAGRLPELRPGVLHPAEATLSPDPPSWAGRVAPGRPGTPAAAPPGRSTGPLHREPLLLQLRDQFLASGSSAATNTLRADGSASRGRGVRSRSTPGDAAVHRVEVDATRCVASRPAAGRAGRFAGGPRAGSSAEVSVFGPAGRSRSSGAGARVVSAGPGRRRTVTWPDPRPVRLGRRRGRAAGVPLARKSATSLRVCRVPRCWA